MVLQNSFSAVGKTVKNALSPLLRLFDFPIEYRGADFKRGLIITELDDKYKPSIEYPEITLAGNQLPFDVVPFGGKQNIVKTYYPGNPEPSVQVLGGQESDITLVGELKDRKIADPTRNTLYGSSYQIALELDEKRKRGNVLKFQLGEMVRYCLIQETRFKIRTLGRIPYEIVITVIGDKPPIDCPFIEPALSLPYIPNVKLAAAMSAFQDAADSAPPDFPADVNDLISGYLSAVATPIAALTKFVDNVLNTAENAAKLYDRALGLIKNARTASVVFKRRVGQLELFVGTARIRGTTVVSEAKRILNAKYIYETVHKPTVAVPTVTASQLALIQANIDSYFTKESTKIAAKQDRGFESLDKQLKALEMHIESLKSQLPKRRYAVKQNDTLQKIAALFYNDAGLWENIYDHNNLQTTVLTSGTVLEIPDV